MEGLNFGKREMERRRGNAAKLKHMLYKHVLQRWAVRLLRPANRSILTRAISKMKEKMGEMTATPSMSQAVVLPHLPDHVLMTLPKVSVLKRTLGRKKQKLNSAEGSIPVPSSSKDYNFHILEKFNSILRYDSGPGDDRILIFGCLELLGLARADVWLSDGTFKVVPGLF